jgi:hypothetical protein
MVTELRWKSLQDMLLHLQVSLKWSLAIKEEGDALNVPRCQRLPQEFQQNSLAAIWGAEEEKL